LLQDQLSAGTAGGDPAGGVRPAGAEKVVFDYKIRDSEDERLLATGHSVQVFMDTNYQLVWDNPPFYLEWKKKWNQL